MDLEGDLEKRCLATLAPRRPKAEGAAAIALTARKAKPFDAFRALLSSGWLRARRTPGTACAEPPRSDRGESSLVKLATTVPARRARWWRILPRTGSIVVLAALSACASQPPPVAAPAQGPYLATRPEGFESTVVGAGHCVDFVKVAAGAPQTAAWRKGAQVRGNPQIPRGTAIATFEADGTYTNASGNHAAIYLYQDESGIWVYDQWQGRPVHKRLIRFEGGSGGAKGSKSNDAKRFAVIG